MYIEKNQNKSYRLVNVDNFCLHLFCAAVVLTRQDWEVPMRTGFTIWLMFFFAHGPKQDNLVGARLLSLGVNASQALPNFAKCASSSYLCHFNASEYLIVATKQICFCFESEEPNGLSQQKKTYLKTCFGMHHAFAGIVVSHKGQGAKARY